MGQLHCQQPLPCPENRMAMPDAGRMERFMTVKPVTLFGGKGGVGKTTCSAAVAAHCAAMGMKTLIITSDMTPSLADIFETPVGDAVRQIDANLFAFEISQDAIVARWKEKFSNDFADILSQLIDLEALDGESRHQLLDYIGSAPSLREETMLDLIVDLIESNRFDRIIWDTAPAGETLNLLNMPRFIRRHLTAGAKVFQGLDKIGKHLTSRRSIAATMDEWIRLSERIARFVQERTEFVVVAKPEGLVTRHVERLLGTLREYRVAIRGMVVNGVIEASDSDTLRSIQAVQAVHLAELCSLAGDLPTAVLPLSQQDIRGLAALRCVGASLCGQLELV
jgi:arsenite-transporting ATPase